MYFYQNNENPGGKMRLLGLNSPVICNLCAGIGPLQFGVVLVSILLVFRVLTLFVCFYDLFGLSIPKIDGYEVNMKSQK